MYANLETLKYAIELGIKTSSELSLFRVLRQIYNQAEALELIVMTREV